MKTLYFPIENSIYQKTGANPKEVVEAVGYRYVKENPEVKPEFGIYQKSELSICNSNGKFNWNLERVLPEAQSEDFAWIATRFSLKEDIEVKLVFTFYGATKIYMDGEFLAQTEIWEEVSPDMEKVVVKRCGRGDHILMVLCQKKITGFGCTVRTVNPRWQWISFYEPFDDRKHIGGCMWSESVKKADEVNKIYKQFMVSEENSCLYWYPKIQNKNVTEDKKSQTEKYHCAWVGIRIMKEVLFRLSSNWKEVKCWIDGKRIEHFTKKVHLAEGEHNVLLVSQNRELILSLTKSEEFTKYGVLYTPIPVKQYSGWLYLWGLEEKEENLKPELLLRTDRVFNDGLTGTYWCSDILDGYIRPYLKSRLFGQWNYPLGVTLYGLLKCGETFRIEDFCHYVAAHIGVCVDYMRYAKWDKQQYGVPEINFLISNVEMLDDCGAFGAAMLEDKKSQSLERQKEIDETASEIYQFISNDVKRTKKGAMCRKIKNSFINNTIWADDLYMSIPFLIRYAKLHKEETVLEFCAKQFLLYMDYLYMPQKKLISHVYDMKFHSKTMIPWGRGNGWAIFTLSELLIVYPEKGYYREELIQWFRKLSDTYKELQGESGLWNQLLDDKESYEETSATAMFICAFCRGIRFHWMNEDNISAFKECVLKAWTALCTYAIDNSGNVYGICKGSGYSFSREYYREQLLWNLNDTHGIGMVLLAGAEIYHMMTGGTNEFEK